MSKVINEKRKQKLTIDEKLNIIGNEYDISIEENFRKDVSIMCNLGQGYRRSESDYCREGTCACIRKFLMKMRSL